MKNKQKEFKITPERTPLGKKAIEYLNIKEEIESKKEDLEAIKPGLVQEFIKARKTAITVEGFTVSYSHLENDKITVKQ